MSTETNSQSISEKIKILSEVQYGAICEFIRNFQGLAIDCEIALTQQLFPHIDPNTLKCIQQTELGNLQRSNYWRYEQRANEMLRRFEQQAAQSSDSTLLLKMAQEERFTPVNMCRAIIREKYGMLNKVELSRLLKYPQLIEHEKLAANIMQCLSIDTQDGPLVDLRRRLVGEEYEIKLKEHAVASGMHFYDEHALRQLGYDKTPDIKMILPFLYKGEVVNWIESKAVFGDIATHRTYIEQQLNSYCNRFGSGIIIYWFGYQEQVPNMSENSVGVTVLADFPSAADIVLMDLGNKNYNEPKVRTAHTQNCEKSDEEKFNKIVANKEYKADVQEVKSVNQLEDAKIEAYLVEAVKEFNFKNTF